MVLELLPVDEAVVVHVDLIEDVLDHGVLPALCNDDSVLLVDPLDDVLCGLLDRELLIFVGIALLEPRRNLVG